MFNLPKREQRPKAGKCSIVAAAILMLAVTSTALGETSIVLTKAMDTAPAGTAQVDVVASSDAAGSDFDIAQITVRSGDVDCSIGGTTPPGGYVPVWAGHPYVTTIKLKVAAGPNTVCGTVSGFDGPVKATARTVFTSIGSLPGDLYNCDSFPLADGTTAQQYLIRWPSDPSRLDGDSDGIACELSSSPIPPPSAPVAPPVTVIAAPPPPAASVAVAAGPAASRITTRLKGTALPRD